MAACTSMSASVTMEIGVNLRVGALPGDLTDVEGRRGKREISASSLADYRLVQYGSLKTTSKPAMNNNNNMAFMRANAPMKRGK